MKTFSLAIASTGLGLDICPKVACSQSESRPPLCIYTVHIWSIAPGALCIALDLDVSAAMKLSLTSVLAGIALSQVAVVQATWPLLYVSSKALQAGITSRG